MELGIRPFSSPVLSELTDDVNRNITGNNCICGGRKCANYKGSGWKRTLTAVGYLRHLRLPLRNHCRLSCHNLRRPAERQPEASPACALTHGPLGRGEQRRFSAMVEKYHHLPLSSTNQINNELDFAANVQLPLPSFAILY